MALREELKLLHVAASHAQRASNLRLECWPASSNYAEARPELPPELPEGVDGVNLQVGIVQHYVCRLLLAERVRHPLAITVHNEEAAVPPRDTSEQRGLAASGLPNKHAITLPAQPPELAPSAHDETCHHWPPREREARERARISGQLQQLPAPPRRAIEACGKIAAPEALDECEALRPGRGFKVAPCLPAERPTGRKHRTPNAVELSAPLQILGEVPASVLARGHHEWKRRLAVFWDRTIEATVVAAGHVNQPGEVISEEVAHALLEHVGVQGFAEGRHDGSEKWIPHRPHPGRAYPVHQDVQRTARARHCGSAHEPVLALDGVSGDHDAR